MNIFLKKRPMINCEYFGLLGLNEKEKWDEKAVLQIYPVSHCISIYGNYYTIQNFDDSVICAGATSDCMSSYQNNKQFEAAAPQKCPDNINGQVCYVSRESLLEMIFLKSFLIL